MFFFFDFDTIIQDYYLAYFDILGYKSFFKNDENPYDFLNVIHGVMDDIHAGVDIAHSISSAEIGIRAYSDNILFYIKDEDNELQAMSALSYLISLTQRRLLEKYSLLIRGGITKGKFYPSNEFVFGKGLIDVYELESKIAIYPRVILSKNIFSVETIKALEHSGYISKDSDDFYFIQYMNALGKEDNYETIRKNIKTLINRNCRYKNAVEKEVISDREKLISKYSWLITRYNSFCENSNLKEYQIDYETYINSKVLKTEIKCK